MLPQKITIPENSSTSVNSSSSSSSSIATNSRRTKRLRLRNIIAGDKIAEIRNAIRENNSIKLMEFIATEEDAQLIRFGKQYYILTIERFRLDDRVCFLEAHQKKSEWDWKEWDVIVEKRIDLLRNFLGRQSCVFYGEEWLQGDYSEILEQERKERLLFHTELFINRNTKFIQETVLLGRYNRNNVCALTAFKLHPDNKKLGDKNWLLRIFGISYPALAQDLPSKVDKFEEVRFYLALEIERAIDYGMFELNITESQEYYEFCKHASMQERRNFFASSAICSRYITECNQNGILAFGHEALLLYLKFNQHNNGFYVWRCDSATSELRLIDRSYHAVIDPRKIPKNLTIGEYIETLSDSKITYGEIFHVVLEDEDNSYVLLADNGICCESEKSSLMGYDELLARLRQAISDNHTKLLKIPLAVTSNLQGIAPVLEHKYSVNSVINLNNKDTLLHEAVVGRALEALKFLLKNDGLVFSENIHKVTPLSLAMEQKDNVCLDVIQPYLAQMQISSQCPEDVIAEKNLQIGLELFKKAKSTLDKHIEKACKYRTAVNNRWWITKTVMYCVSWASSSGRYDYPGIHEHYSKLYLCYTQFKPKKYKRLIKDLCNNRGLVSSDMIHKKMQEMADSLICDMDFEKGLKELQKIDEERIQQQLRDKNREIAVLTAALEQKEQNFKITSTRHDEHKLELQALLQQQEARFQQERESHKLELEKLELRRIQDLQESERKRQDLEQKMHRDLQELEKKRIQDQQESERKRLESEQKLREEFLGLLLSRGNITPMAAPVIAPTLEPLANMLAVNPAATNTVNISPTLATTPSNQQQTGFFAHK